MVSDEKLSQVAMVMPIQLLKHVASHSKGLHPVAPSNTDGCTSLSIGQ